MESSEHFWTILFSIPLIWLLIELFHHIWSIRIIAGIDALYARARMDREVDLVEHVTPVEQFHDYWGRLQSEQKLIVENLASRAGMAFNEMVSTTAEHPVRDLVQRKSAWESVPITFLFRTVNSWRIIQASRALQSMGFARIVMPHVHLFYYSSGGSKKKLLLVYPQFSGEFRVLSVLAELQQMFDILFVCPLGIQCSWWQVPARHTDTLEEYFPLILKYDKIIPLTWSAGNIPFQVLDRFLELKNLRHKIHTVVRLDPLGHPTSNFVVYSGVPIPWHELWLKFLKLGSPNGNIRSAKFWDHVGCLGLSYLLKTPHGYSHLKCSRFLRGGTKLAPTPYHEHHFVAKFDPLWNPLNPFFETDKKILCAENNVTEYSMDGFHGMWLNHVSVRTHVFPVLINHA